FTDEREFVRFAERVSARFADPMIAHMARVNVLGEQGREQDVAALRAVGKAHAVRHVASLGCRRWSVVQQHGEASSACGSYFPLPYSPYHSGDQDYGARPWRSNESFVNHAHICVRFCERFSENLLLHCRRM